MNLKTLQENKNEKELFALHEKIYVRKDGSYLAFPMSSHYAINNYRQGNINELSDDDLYGLIVTLLEESLNRENYLTVDKCGKNSDKVYLWEEEDYKENKCQNVKYISIMISNNDENKICIIENECLGKHYWGGGRYVHLLSIDCSKEKLINKVREIVDYKKGHLPSSLDKSFKKK